MDSTTALLKIEKEKSVLNQKEEGEAFDPVQSMHGFLR